MRSTAMLPSIVCELKKLSNSFSDTIVIQEFLPSPTFKNLLFLVNHLLLSDIHAWQKFWNLFQFAAQWVYSSLKPSFKVTVDLEGKHEVWFSVLLFNVMLSEKHLLVYGRQELVLLLGVHQAYWCYKYKYLYRNIRHLHWKIASFSADFTFFIYTSHVIAIVLELKQEMAIELNPEQQSDSLSHQFPSTLDSQVLSTSKYLSDKNCSHHRRKNQVLPESLRFNVLRELEVNELFLSLTELIHVSME